MKIEMDEFCCLNEMDHYCCLNEYAGWKYGLGERLRIMSGWWCSLVQLCFRFWFLWGNGLLEVRLGRFVLCSELEAPMKTKSDDPAGMIAWHMAPENKIMANGVDAKESRMDGGSANGGRRGQAAKVLLFCIYLWTCITRSTSVLADNNGWASRSRNATLGGK